jgi:hypothetical protein
MNRFNNDIRDKFAWEIVEQLPWETVVIESYEKVAIVITTNVIIEIPGYKNILLFVGGILVNTYTTWDKEIEDVVDRVIKLK